MPRKMSKIETAVASVVWKIIVASSDRACELAYVPAVVRALRDDAGLPVADSIQAIRDLLSLGLLEMHFDYKLKGIAKDDDPFTFPAPGSGKKNTAPWKQPWMRRSQKPDQELCADSHCGRNAPDFSQPDLLFKGSYEAGEEGKKKRVRFDVDLTDYDEIAVNTSAGKDSQAMLDAVYRECRRLGIEDRLVAYHADLEQVEWPGTPELAELQARYYGITFDKIARPQGDLLEHVRQRGEWMGPKKWMRYCTGHMKTGQIDKLFTRDAKAFHEMNREQGNQRRPIRILNCIGIRAQESTERGRAYPFKNHKSTSVQHIDNWYPIFDWSSADVWETIARSGVAHHWAYDLGMPRLSCVFCVMGNKNALMLGGEYNPELLDKYVEVEHELLSLPQTVRSKKGDRPRASEFKHKFRIEEVREALERGERARGDIEVNSFQ